MISELAVLILEDVASDAELIAHELERGGLRCRRKRVQTRLEFIRAIDNFRPQLILADYSLPSFDGISALRIAQERCPDVPFIFVSGAIGEERAIAGLKQGATDYILKDSLKRLVPAITAALREADERIARQRAETELQESEHKHRALLEFNNSIVGNLNSQAMAESIATSLSKLLPLSAVSLLLVEGDRCALKTHVTTDDFSGSGKTIDESEFALSDTHVKSAVREQVVVSRPGLSVRADSSYERALAASGLKSVVSVPLPGQSAALGMLTIGSRSPGAFAETCESFLNSIGHQVGLAVRSMLAYEQVDSLKSRLEQENAYLQEEVVSGRDYRGIIGESAALRKVLDTVAVVAQTSASALITGETGTGKELIARAVHAGSTRCEHPLIKVNCASIPAELFESEFFGHTKGAFTGAVKNRVGRFELAHGGTIFLDEVCEIPIELQSKLLRVLQEGEFERVGEERTRNVDVRVIAATNRNPQDEIKAGRFREDLYFRLNVVPIWVPPLRDRGDDIQLLAEHLLHDVSRRFNRGPFTLRPEQVGILKSYCWPGNVRELRNVIERAVVMSTGTTLQLNELATNARTVQTTEPQPARGFLTENEFRERERANILAVMEAASWRIAGNGGAAELLGLPASTLANRARKLGLTRPHHGSPDET